jgi:S-adenosyl-L-methionine hydrolase (adenosine-forming)
LIRLLNLQPTTYNRQPSRVNCQLPTSNMPILTLTSDFGISDPLVGALKGEILKVNEGFQLVDLTHEIAPFNYMQAAYQCRTIFRNFSKESFHLVLVNLFDSNLDHVLLVKHQDQFIGIPDNGLIYIILDKVPDEVVSLPILKKSDPKLGELINVWMGAFSALSSGKTMNQVGTATDQIVHRTRLKAYISAQYIEGQVLMVDRFNNIVVNITIHDFEEARKGRKFKIVLLRDAFIEEISHMYSDVPEGEKLARFNEAGYLEIAINKGSAAPLFGLGEYGLSSSQQKRQYYQTIKIFFE